MKYVIPYREWLIGLSQRPNEGSDGFAEAAGGVRGGRRRAGAPAACGAGGVRGRRRAGPGGRGAGGPGGGARPARRATF
jgi:hypothetical protein